jgi:hypothetical protein
MNKKGGMDWELVMWIVAIVVLIIALIYFYPQLSALGKGATEPIEEATTIAVG